MPLLSKERADRELKTEAKKREKEKVGLNLEAIRSALSLSLSLSLSCVAIYFEMLLWFRNLVTCPRLY